MHAIGSPCSCDILFPMAGSGRGVGRCLGCCHLADRAGILGMRIITGRDRMDDIQTQDFPQPTCAEIEPMRLERPAFALYIDADNQSAQSAAALIDVLQHDVGGSIHRVTLAGNDKGNKNDSWIKALRELIPGLAIENLSVPCRPNAADIALILALGKNLAEHLRTRMRVVVVSRDTLLLDAAEQVKDAGVRLYVAYADSQIPTARRTNLTTFLLPNLAEPPQAAERTVEPDCELRIHPIRPMSQPASAVPKEVARAVKHVRETCVEQPGGGYSPTDVGQALTKLGYQTPASRRGGLGQFPGLQEAGKRMQKRLLF